MTACVASCISCLQHKNLSDAKEMKIILVGNSNVGKTAIIKRFVYGKYERSNPTVSFPFVAT